MSGLKRDIEFPMSGRQESQRHENFLKKYRGLYGYFDRADKK